MQSIIIIKLKLSKLFSLKYDKDSAELALAWFYKDVRFLVIYGDARDQTVVQNEKMRKYCGINE